MSLNLRLETIATYEKVLAQTRNAHERAAYERELARTDLFYLLVYICGRRDVNRDWVFERCREVEDAPNGYLDLWPREHFKSSVITFGLTIRDILRDPEITVGIFSYSRPIAKAFLRQIKSEFETNERLRMLFPDIIWDNPHRDALKWSEDDGIIVRRLGNPKESTVEAWGLVDAQPTSKHFQLMVYDDVVTESSVTTPDMIAKVTRAWEVSRNLTAENGATRYIGTRWHHADTYREIIARGAAVERRHTITKDGTPGGEPVMWSRELVARKRLEMGKYVFNAQMLLDPTAERDHGFLDEWLRYYERENSTGMNKYLLVDPANSKKRQSDYTAMVVIGLAADGNYYLLDAVRDKLSLTERGDCLFSLHRRWKPLRVGYEQYGMQADIDYLRTLMRERNYRFEIIKLAGSLSKYDRIMRMVPIWEAGKFWLPESLEKIDYEGHRHDLVAQFVDFEYRAYPVAEHDDMFDAISRIADPELAPLVWPKPAKDEDRYARDRRPRRRVTWMAA